MNTKTRIASAQATENLTINIYATAYGWHLATQFADGTEIELAIYNSEGKARAAANREWLRLRKAEQVAA